MSSPSHHSNIEKGQETLQSDSESSKRKRTESSNSVEGTLPSWVTASSPPKFVSFDELMKTMVGLDKMAIAHEIAMNADFKLQPSSPSPDVENANQCLSSSSTSSKPTTPVKSIEDLQKLTKAIVHKAFWDALDSDLKENPPIYDHALVLLAEVKDTLLSLLLAHHTKLRQDINEHIDLELIKQQCENACLDFMPVATYVLDVMAKLCAPVRDEAIQRLRKCSDVVTLYRGILETLNAMKVDMANFAISSLRPVIQQHSVEFEKKKFNEYLAINPDGLKITKDWLRQTLDKLDESSIKGQKFMKSDEQTESQNLPSCSSAMIDNSDIMYESACEILDWPDSQFEQRLPETFIVDMDRLKSLRSSYLKLILTATVVITTVNFGGKAFSGAKDFKRLLKEKLIILFQDVRRDKTKESLAAVSEYVCTEFEKYTKSIGFEAGSLEISGRKELLKNQLISLDEDGNPVTKIVSLNTVDGELVQVAALFFRLLSHNIAVFREHYDSILNELKIKHLEDRNKT